MHIMLSYHKILWDDELHRLRQICDDWFRAILEYNLLLDDGPHSVFHLRLHLLVQVHQLFALLGLHLSTSLDSFHRNQWLFQVLNLRASAVKRNSLSLSYKPFHTKYDVQLS